MYPKFEEPLEEQGRGMTPQYTIVGDSSADLEVNFKIVQNQPTIKAVCTKISKTIFLHISQ